MSRSEIKFMVSGQVVAPTEKHMNTSLAIRQCLQGLQGPHTSVSKLYIYKVFVGWLRYHWLDQHSIISVSGGSCSPVSS